MYRTEVKLECCTIGNTHNFSRMHQEYHETKMDGPKWKSKQLPKGKVDLVEKIH